MSKHVTVAIQEKTYNDAAIVHALGKVNFTIEPGKIVSILGPSGCGKSTLLRLLVGLDVDFTGEIKIGDRVVADPNRECSIVFQEPRLLPWLSVSNNIRFGVYAAGESDQTNLRIQELIALFDLTTFRDAYPHQLSGGMAQRVALARALINLPDLLLLDEPFGALDELTKQRLQDELLKVLEQAKTTVLMVTHDIEEAIYLSDKVLIMSKRPGEILKEFSISLPRPRSRTDQNFRDLYIEILESMRDEFKLL